MAVLVGEEEMIDEGSPVQIKGGQGAGHQGVIQPIIRTREDFQSFRLGKNPAILRAAAVKPIAPNRVCGRSRRRERRRPAPVPATHCETDHRRDDRVHEIVIHSSTAIASSAAHFFSATDMSEQGEF